MCAVNDIESILVLMLAAALLVRLAEFGKIPAPIVLVVGGLAIAFVPGLPTSNSTRTRSSSSSCRRWSSRPAGAPRRWSCAR